MKKRVIFIDYIRFFAILSVVFIHSTSNALVNQYPNITSKTIMLFSTLTSTAVPMFFFLSGAFNINRKNEDLGTMKKKIHKLFNQLIIWTAVYYLIFAILKWDSSPLMILRALFSSQVGHLWFMYPLISLYVLTPFISRLYNRIKEKEKRMLLFITFVLPLILSTLSIKIEMIHVPSFSIFFPELGLYMLGKYIYDKKDDLKNKKCFVLSIIGMVVGIIGILLLAQYYIHLNGISHSKPYFDYNKIPNIILTLSIFLFYLNIETLLYKIPKKVTKFIKYVGSNTLGIYLIHKVFIYCFPTIKIGSYYITSNTGSFINMFLGTTIYFLLSVISVFILKKIRLLKTIV